MLRDKVPHFLVKLDHALPLFVKVGIPVTVGLGIYGALLGIVQHTVGRDSWPWQLGLGLSIIVVTNFILWISLYFLVTRRLKMLQEAGSSLSSATAAPIILGSWSQNSRDDLVRTLDRFNKTAEMIVAFRHQLVESAITDPLTGVYNRRYFEQELVLELRKAERAAQPLGILMVDIDRLKAINDEFGVLIGDNVLKQVAQALLDTLRTTDMVARYSGNHFVAVLPGSDRSAAVAAGKRVAEAVARTRIQGTDRAVSVGIGTAVFPHDGTEDQALLSAADLSLKMAKRGDGLAV
ncbi:MAG TPA: GGDEF domain-containing protein [Dehalococcoidia bacterium]|nr:GGDEF domain-containing protein [Dehalococcoidia bacterium]